MKSAFAYFGGKTGLAPSIVAMMPAHRVYIEPYFGSGAVLFAKPTSKFEIVNDLDDQLVNFWRVLRQRPDDLARVCAHTPHSRTEFTACGDSTGDDLERARRFWTRVNQSFAKTAGSKTGWSVTTARSTSIPATIANRIGRFTAVAQRLTNVTIENCDAPDLVARLATPDTVVYCDPPYLASTRVLRSGNGGDYRVDAGHPDHHERLAEVLVACPGKVILSGYPSPLYDALYAGWETVDVPVTAFSSNMATPNRTSRTERLWLNFDRSGQLDLTSGVPA